MSSVQAGRRRFDADLVIFDKDGTLFDFNIMWLRIFRRQAETLAALAGDDEGFLDALYADVGAERAGERLDPRGPLALATYEELKVILALAMYRRGRPWDEAMSLVAEATDLRHWPPLHELTRPIGDVAGRLRRLRAVGLRIAVVTTDVRALTLAMLELAGLRDLVDAVVCADDGVALKPAPDGILAACRLAGVTPTRAVMVGDSPTDLLAGRAAGVAACVGVTSGVSQREDLEPLADSVIASIEELDVLA